MPGDLLSCCEDELAAAFALRACCLGQQAALVGGGAAAVATATAACQEAVLTWREAAEARAAAAAEVAAALGRPGCSELGSLASLLSGEDAARLRERRSDLMAAWSELARLNRQNDILARHSLAVIDLSLQRLVGGRAPTYGASGRRKLTARVLSKGG